MRRLGLLVLLPLLAPLPAGAQSWPNDSNPSFDLQDGSWGQFWRLRQAQEQQAALPSAPGYGSGYAPQGRAPIPMLDWAPPPAPAPAPARRSTRRVRRAPAEETRAAPASPAPATAQSIESLERSLTERERSLAALRRSLDEDRRRLEATRTAQPSYVPPSYTPPSPTTQLPVGRPPVNASPIGQPAPIPLR